MPPGSSRTAQARRLSASLGPGSPTSPGPYRSFGSQPFFETVGAALARAAPGPHWHLRLLAVDADAQGRGLGAALLAHGLGRADASGGDVTLETFAGRAVGFYLGHGFEVLVNGVEPVSGLDFWALHRPAQR